MTPSGLEENVADRLRLRRSAQVPGAAELLAVVLDQAFAKRELGLERELCVGKTVRSTPDVSATLARDEDALAQRLRAARFYADAGYYNEGRHAVLDRVSKVTTSCLPPSDDMNGQRLLKSLGATLKQALARPWKRDAIETTR